MGDKKRKANSIYFILAAIFAVIGIWQYTHYLNDDSFIFLLPTIIYFILYVLTSKSNLEDIHTIVLIIGIITFVVWGAASLWAEVGFYQCAEVTNLRNYDKSISSFYSKEMVNHFPASIPDDAHAVRFSFRRGCMQGSPHIQLRYSASPSLINEQYNRFYKMMTWSSKSGYANKELNNRKEIVPMTTEFYISDQKHHILPDDYEIMAIHKQPTLKIANSATWYRGDYYGVTISKQRNEIIYWAEAVH